MGFKDLAWEKKVSEDVLDIFYKPAVLSYSLCTQCQ